jgi:hypothetical protein
MRDVVLAVVSKAERGSAITAEDLRVVWVGQLYI